MVIGAVITGTLAGIAAAIVAVMGFGLPVWAGLLIWSGFGTLVTLMPLVALALLPDEVDEDEALVAA
jgi:hypothetical protein